MKKSLALTLLLLAVTTMGWAAGMPVQFLMSSFFDDEAAPLAGGLVYSYSAGTTTPLALYEDAALTTPISQPLQLDAYGRALAFGSGNYKFVIKNSDGVTIATYDGLEYISTVAPTSLVVTNLTVASATFNEIYGKGGTLASMTFSGGLVSNSNLGNCKILAQPTVASDPVDFGYYSTDAASRTAYSLAALASHTSTFVNPHGTDTYQTNFIASAVVGPLCASTTASNTGYLVVLASGARLVGDSTLSTLHFNTEGNATEALLSYGSNQLVSVERGDGECGVYYNLSSNVIDFGGATMTNFYAYPLNSLGGGNATEAQVFSTESSSDVGIPLSGLGTFASLSIPATFTEGFYLVDWSATFTNASYTVANYGSFDAKLYCNANTQQTRLGFIGTNAGSIPEFQNVGGRVVIHLTYGDVLYIRGEQGTIMSNGVQGTGYSFLLYRLADSLRSY